MLPPSRRGLRFVLLLLLILLAYALRVYRLDLYALRGDESFTVLLVQKPFAEMWDTIRLSEPHPPLMYLLLRGWVLLAGSSEFAARYFAVFWGVLCVPLIYQLARRLFRQEFGERVALVAALLLAVNPFQVWYSQDVRDYTLWPALSLLALCFFWKWLDAVQSPRTRSWRRTLLPLALFASAELAALYTHYYEAFLALALNAFVLARYWRRREILAPWVGAQLALAALYLPYALLLSNRALAYVGSGAIGVPLWDVWQQTFSAFVLGDTLDPSVRNLLWAPLALALGVSLIALWRCERERAHFLLAYFGVPSIAIFALSQFRPLFFPRYLAVVASAYYLAFAYGIGALAPRGRADSTRVERGRLPGPWRWTAAAAGLAVFGAAACLALANYFGNPAYAKAPDWRGLAQAIADNAKPGDVIVQNFPETSLIYYNRSGLPISMMPPRYAADANTPKGLTKLNNQYARIWFIPAAEGFWDPDGYVETWLARHDDLLSETRVGTFRLQLYSTPHAFEAAVEPLDAEVGGYFRVAGYRLERGESTVRLVLYWQTVKTPRRDLDILVRLLSGVGGATLAQGEWPLKEDYPANQWQPGEIIVGRYDLSTNPEAAAISMEVYDPVSERRLQIRPDAGGKSDSLFIPLVSDSRR